MLDQFTSMVAGFSLFWEYKAVMLPGLWYNFLVFFLVVGFGIVLGLAFSTLRLSTNIVLRAIGTFYTGLFRKRTGICDAGVVLLCTRFALD